MKILIIDDQPDLLDTLRDILEVNGHDSPITVYSAVRDRLYRIEISDQGPGLTLEQCTRIGPFVQFDRQKREQQGLGLGLAIAQTTMKLAGGNLAIEPGRNSCGLRVVFTFPLEHT